MCCGVYSKSGLGCTHGLAAPSQTCPGKGLGEILNPNPNLNLLRQDHFTLQLSQTAQQKPLPDLAHTLTTSPAASCC